MPLNDSFKITQLVADLGLEFRTFSMSCICSVFILSIQIMLIGIIYIFDVQNFFFSNLGFPCGLRYCSILKMVQTCRVETLSYSCFSKITLKILTWKMVGVFYCNITPK